MDYKKSLEDIEKALSELKEENTNIPIIVEGDKDIEALRKLDEFRFIYFDGKNLFQCDRIREDQGEDEVEVDPEPAGKTGKKGQQIDQEEEEELLAVVEEVEEIYD